MQTSVLVHGSWHDGTAWSAVQEYLERAGFRVFAPTIAGHGKHTSNDVQHDDCVNSLVQHIVQHDLHDILLVGHSFGGSDVFQSPETRTEIDRSWTRLISRRSYRT